MLEVLDEATLSGSATLNIDRYCEPLSDTYDVPIETVSGVLQTALTKLENGELELETTLDQWLAPRIHSAIRIPRRMAGDMGFWTWLVLSVGRPYTWTRWKRRNGPPTMYRYTGDFKRNSLARLWWFAEMTRNGSDYSPIVTVLRDPSTAQYAMELRYSMYKPAVIAFGKIADERQLGFAELKDLSKRINAYLSLRALEAMGLDPSSDDRDSSWWNDAPELGSLVGDEMPIGPQDGFVDLAAVADLETWFGVLADQTKKAIAMSAS